MYVRTASSNIEGGVYVLSFCFGHLYEELVLYLTLNWQIPYCNTEASSIYFWLAKNKDVAEKYTFIF
jgi:hypothetical protein